MQTFASVHAGESIQTAINNSSIGTIIGIEAGDYFEDLVINKSIELQVQSIIPGGRRRPNWSPVRVTGKAQTLTMLGSNIRITGLTFQSIDSSQTIVVDKGTQNILDKVSILGNSKTGQHRGVAANGKSLAIIQNHIDDCWLPKRDAQAVACWDGTDGLVIFDSYLGGGAQSFMSGGSNPQNADRIPKNIKISNCTFGKNSNWYDLGAQIKCAFEVKNGINIFVNECDFQYAGNAEGQGAYLIVLTPRDQTPKGQPGRAPYTVVKDIEIHKCTGSHASGIASILGSDSNFPTQTTTNITIRDFKAMDIDSSGVWKGRGRLFEFDRAPQRVTIEDVEVDGRNLNAQFYFIGKPPLGLIARNLQLPETKYGLKIDNGGQGLEAVKAYAPDAILDL